MKIGKSLFYEQETNQIVSMYDPDDVAWKLKSKGKLVPDIVGYISTEISRAAWFFIEHRGKNKWKGFWREIETSNT